jgi:hypothetical protein
MTAYRPMRGCGSVSASCLSPVSVFRMSTRTLFATLCCLLALTSCSGSDSQSSGGSDLNKGSCLVPAPARRLVPLSPPNGQVATVTGRISVGSSDANHFYACLSDLSSTRGGTLYVRVFQDLFASPATDFVALSDNDLSTYREFSLSVRKWDGACYSVGVYDGNGSNATQLARAAIGCS